MHDARLKGAQCEVCVFCGLSVGSDIYVLRTEVPLEAQLVPLFACICKPPREKGAETMLSSSPSRTPSLDTPRPPLRKRGPKSKVHDYKVIDHSMVPASEKATQRTRYEQRREKPLILEVVSHHVGVPPRVIGSAGYLLCKSQLDKSMS